MGAAFDGPSNLHRRGYRGSVDTRDNQLIIRLDTGEGATKDLKTLSGGEKSTSTLALILALGEVTMHKQHFVEDITIFV